MSTNRATPWTARGALGRARRDAGATLDGVDARGGAAMTSGRMETAGEDSTAATRGDDAEEAAEDDALEHAPTVFVGFPHASLVCPQCRDVMLSPVVAENGTTYCAKCAPREDAEDALAEDAEVEDAIQSLPVLCRRAMVLKRNAQGASEWCWKADGCGESGIRLRLRDVHDRECAFVPRRCWYPYDSRVECEANEARKGRDYCGAIVTKIDYVSHVSECAWRSVKCDVKGCEDVVPFCKMTQHALTCPSALVKCPNECEWDGKRRELAEHREICPREYIKCGFINLQHEDGNGCLYGCERDAIDSHRTDCDFRPWHCPSCDAVVNAMHASIHAVKCEESRRPCPRCRAMVRTRAFDAHQEFFCVGASKPCAFAAFGCLEVGAETELRAHERDAAPRHLRLVVKALEAERSSGRKKSKVIERMEQALNKFGEEYASLATKASERVRFVESKAIEEMDRLNEHMESSKRAYDAHVVALEKEIEQLKADRAAAVDADAHLAKLDTAITREEAQQLLDAAKGEMASVNAQFAKLQFAIDVREQKWEEDIEHAATKEAATREAVRREIASIIATTSGADDDLLKRMDTLSTEIREISRTLNLDLMDLADKQKELEDAWRRANENPRLRASAPRAKNPPSPTRGDSDSEASEAVSVKPRRKFKTTSDTTSETASERSHRRLGSATLRARRLAAAAAASSEDLTNAPIPPSIIAMTDSERSFDPTSRADLADAPEPPSAAAAAAVADDDILRGALLSRYVHVTAKPNAAPEPNPLVVPRPPWIDSDDDL
jgi:hypothetical protein